MDKIKTLTEEINRIKSLFTEERLYGNLVDGGKNTIQEQALNRVIKGVMSGVDATSGKKISSIADEAKITSRFTNKMKTKVKSLESFDGDELFTYTTKGNLFNDYKTSLKESFQENGLDLDLPVTIQTKTGGFIDTTIGNYIDDTLDGDTFNNLMNSSISYVMQGKNLDELGEATTSLFNDMPGLKSLITKNADFIKKEIFKVTDELKTHSSQAKQKAISQTKNIKNPKLKKMMTGILAIIYKIPKYITSLGKIKTWGKILTAAGGFYILGVLVDLIALKMGFYENWYDIKENMSVKPDCEYLKQQQAEGRDVNYLLSLWGCGFPDIPDKNTMDEYKNELNEISDSLKTNMDTDVINQIEIKANEKFEEYKDQYGLGDTDFEEMKKNGESTLEEIGNL
jgi:hypothetical protein